MIEVESAIATAKRYGSFVIGGSRGRPRGATVDDRAVVYTTGVYKGGGRI